MFCPIMNLLALAFADGAFKEDGIKTPEDLFKLEIPHFKEVLAIQWKPECRETPIFRRLEGSQISETKPLTFDEFNNYLKRLGVLAGYPQVLTSYVLRRGAANAIDCKFGLDLRNTGTITEQLLLGPEVTEAQRNQVMGHARADVFRRHYMHQTVKVDTQSAYLGTVSRDDLIKTIGLMSAKRDPRAPLKVKTATIEQHPQLAKLKSEFEVLG
jgi:integrase